MQAVKILDSRICFFSSELVDLDKTTASKIWYKPHPEEVIHTFDAEWEGGVSFPTIVQFGDKYKMYYMAGKVLNDDQTEDLQEKTFKICVMESDDLIHWVRPSLGIIEFNGSTENNIIYYACNEFFVLNDDNPNCKEGEEVKAIYNITGKRVLHSKYSSDGYHFEEQGLISDKASFDTLNICFYDAKNERYIAYVRGFHRRGGGEFSSVKEALDSQAYVRDIRVMYSKDFKTWTDPVPVNIPININYEMYCPCFFRYYNSDRYMIGLPTRYFDERQEWTPTLDNVSGKESRLKRIAIEPRFGYGITDSIFVSSTDYEKFESSDGVFMGPGIESEDVDNWIYGACFHTQNGIFETINKVTKQREMSILTKIGSWHETNQLLRSTLRVDGFASLSARSEKKIVVTKPFVFEGKSLSLNIATSARGNVYVNLICGEKSVRSYEILGDSLEKKVSFPDFDVAEFSGKEVVMTIELDEADVYSFKFDK